MPSLDNRRLNKKLELRQQLILAGQEELMRRKNLIYFLKNFLNRHFGWFDKWGKEIDRYYHDKYPLLPTLDDLS